MLLLLLLGAKNIKNVLLQGEWREKRNSEISIIIDSSYHITDTKKEEENRQRCLLYINRLLPFPVFGTMYYNFVFPFTNHVNIKLHNNIVCYIVNIMCRTCI